MPKKPPSRETAKEALSERVKTGIPGLDALIEGGFVRNSTVLLCGGCGTGKTLFGAQFLYYGAKDYNEPGIYLSLEERPEDIRKDMQYIGLDPTLLESAGKLSIIYKSPVQFVTSGEIVEANVTQMLKDSIETIGAKRVVIDSTGAFELRFKNSYEIRQHMYEIAQALKEMNVTSILVSEIPEHHYGYSRFGVEEFVTDAVIVLDYVEFNGGAIRSLFIRKIRRTKQKADIFCFDFVPGTGIVVKPVEARFHKYVLSKFKKGINRF